MERVVVGFDNFSHDIDISARISIRKIFIDSIVNSAMHAFLNRTFQVEVPTNLKMDAFVA